MKLIEDDLFINKIIKIIVKVLIDFSFDNKVDYKG